MSHKRLAEKDWGGHTITSTEPDASTDFVDAAQARADAKARDDLSLELLELANQEVTWLLDKRKERAEREGRKPPRDHRHGRKS
jgi:hypothetical protein